jgi:glycosyltransferase involved in cell wall biosynthesis
MTVFLCFFQSDASKSAVLQKSALAVGGIDQVIVYDEKHPLITTLKKKASTSLKFEWGYMRPYIIHYTLYQEAKENDVVIFCDENYMFTGSVRPYVDALLAEKKDAALFRDTSNARNARFCKEDCFVAMDCAGEEYRNAYEISTDFQLYRKSDSLEFLSKYVEFCSDPVVMDSVYRKPNPPEFVTHNHDKSVLTNLCTHEKEKKLVMRFPVTSAGTEDPSGHDLPPILDTSPAMKVPRILVITPTTGTKYLHKCIDSVQKQNILGVIHLIVIDGPEHAENVHAILEPFRNKMPLHTMVLPFNAGAHAWLGHRIYASLAMLLDYDFIAYLDEDNFYDPDHLELMHKLVVKDKLDWTFSLRKIIDTDGNFLTVDNCESLGNMSHSVLRWDDFLVDTSCYFLTPKVAQAMAPYWMHRARTGGIEADRSVCRFLLNHDSFKGKGVPKHTLNYTVAQRADSVKGDFFVKGNAVFNNDFANKKTVYVFLDDEQTTQRFFVDKPEKNVWDLVRGLAAKYNLVNGYALEHRISQDAVALFCTTKGNELPKAFERPDLKKIVYDPSSTSACANADHLLTLLHVPTNPVGKDVVCLGEACPVAQKYVEKLKDITAFDSWDASSKKNPLLRTEPRGPYNNKTFALVVDSRDLFYDALMAGCIPMYYGDELVDIPKDVYIDLKKFKTSNALQKHLDSLPIAKIQKMRERVLEKRGEVLWRVLPEKFAERFDDAYCALSDIHV